MPKELPINVSEILDAFSIPAFVLAADRRVVAWNTGIEQLMGVDREDLLGTVGVGRAGYDDEEANLTLADKIALEPENTHEAYDDISLADPEFTLLNTDDYTVYEDTSIITGADGDDREIWFSGAPLYRDGEFVAVFEIVQDRTKSLRYQREVKQLVESQTDKLAASISQTTESARVIEDEVTAQTNSLQDVRTDMEDLSATMEEVAASSQQVASAADDASKQVDGGLETAAEAREAADKAMEATDALVETVAELGERMGEIESVIDVINDIADQTNLLALNANIEAARAGEAGSGFEVVADEVKNLATETSEHTDTIRERVTEVQRHTTETIDTVEESSEHIESGVEGIGGTLETLEEIADVVEGASAGIEEVATANDEQAKTVEQVTAEVEDVMDRSTEINDVVEEIVEETAEEKDTIDELSEQIYDLTSE